MRLELPCVKGGIQQPPELRNNRACCPNGVASRSQHSCGALQEHRASWLETKRSGTCESRMTIVLPLRHPRQPDDIFRFPPTTPGKFEGTHEGGVNGKLRLPEQREAICNDFQTSPITCRNPEDPCRGRTCWQSHGHLLPGRFGPTTLSIAKPRRPSTPAAAQAARWCPKMSSGRPHLQVRCDKGSGRRRRRSKNTLKHCGSIRNNLSVAQQVKAAAAGGPLCERNRACSGSVIVGSNLESLKCCSTFMETSRCHP